MEKPRTTSKSIEEKPLEELLDLYAKGYQLVSYGQDKKVEVPDVGVFTIREYPSGARYVVTFRNKNEQLQKLDEKWFLKMQKLTEYAIQKKRKLDAKESDSEESNQSI